MTALAHYLRALERARCRQLGPMDTEWRAGVAVALRVLAIGWVEFEGGK